MSIDKLNGYNISPKLILLLNSYLSNRKFKVKINQTYSSVREIKASVPQGSLVGPILFLFYVKDFPNWPEDINASLNQYADDVAIIQRSSNQNMAIEKLNKKIHDIENWCTR